MRLGARVWAGFMAAVLVLGVLTPSATAGPPERVDLLIGFRSTPDRADRSFIERHGGNVKYSYRLVPAIAASVPETAVARLRSNPRVTTVDPDGRVFAVDFASELDNTWGVKRIGAGTVHAGGNVGSSSVRVAVLDSGIDTDHPDLTYEPNCSQSFVSGSPLEDGNGHGTHTAGTVAAVRNGAGVVGTAPSTTLCIYKVLSDGGSGSYSDVVAALQQAVTDGVQVTNNSYGSSGDPGTIVKAAFDNAYAEGILHAGAAGNSGNPPGNGDNCIFPARWSSVIATAATTPDDSRATFSSTCSELELAAPGSRVRSTVPGGGYAEYSGTSMASPHVAGTAALVLAANSTWTNLQVRSRLVETAQDLGSSGHDTKYGHGLVRADLAAASSEPVATGSISGTVTDSSSTAIVGATVSTDTGQQATTDTNGAYTLIEVPTGDRSVTASAAGYVSETKTPVGVFEDQTTTGVDFALVTSTTTSTVSVASVTYTTDGGKSADKHLNVTVALVDDQGNPVGGASVSVRLDLNGNLYGNATGTTGGDGKVVFTAKNAPSGTYTTTATDVTASGLTWDGTTPENSFTK